MATSDTYGTVTLKKSDGWTSLNSIDFSGSTIDIGTALTVTNKSGVFMWIQENDTTPTDFTLANKINPSGKMNSTALISSGSDEIWLMGSSTVNDSIVLVSTYEE